MFIPVADMAPPREARSPSRTLSSISTILIRNDSGTNDAMTSGASSTAPRFPTETPPLNHQGQYNSSNSDREEPVAASSSPREISQAEREYYTYVEDEQKLSTVFQLFTHDPLLILTAASVVFLGSMISTAVLIGTHFGEVLSEPTSLVSIVLLLLLQLQVVLRWQILVRIQRCEYRPKTSFLKFVGGMRNMSPWICVISAIVSNDGGPFWVLFWVLFSLQFFVLDFFYFIVIIFFVVVGMLVAPFWFPYAWLKPKGADKKAIQNLPVVKFDQASFIEQNFSLECSICLAEFENNEDLRRLPCNHFFHKNCVDTWLQENGTCPMCRNDISHHPRENLSLHQDSSSSPSSSSSSSPSPSPVLSQMHSPTADASRQPTNDTDISTDAATPVQEMAWTPSGSFHFTNSSNDTEDIATEENSSVRQAQVHMQVI